MTVESIFARDFRRCKMCIDMRNVWCPIDDNYENGVCYTPDRNLDDVSTLCSNKVETVNRKYR